MQRSRQTKVSIIYLFPEREIERERERERTSYSLNSNLAINKSADGLHEISTLMFHRKMGIFHIHHWTSMKLVGMDNSRVERKTVVTQTYF